MTNKRSVEELTDEDLRAKRQRLRTKLAEIDLEQTMRRETALKRAIKKGMKKHPINPKLDEWIANWRTAEWDFEDGGAGVLGKVRKWILTIRVGKCVLRREQEEGSTDSADWSRSLLEVHSPNIKNWPSCVRYGDCTNGKLSELIKELGIADFCTEQEFCTMCHHLFDIVDVYVQENEDEDDFKSLKMKLPYEKPQEPPKETSEACSDSE